MLRSIPSQNTSPKVKVRDKSMYQESLWYLSFLEFFVLCKYRRIMNSITNETGYDNTLDTANRLRNEVAHGMRKQRKRLTTDESRATENSD